MSTSHIIILVLGLFFALVIVDEILNRVSGFNKRWDNFQKKSERERENADSSN